MRTSLDVEERRDVRHNVTLWPLEWMQPMDGVQAARGMSMFLQSLNGVGFMSSVSLVLRGHADTSVEAFVGVSSLDDAAERQLLRRVFEATTPWIGLGNPLRSLDLPGGERGIAVRFGPGYSHDRTSARWSALSRAVSGSDSPWQLTVNLGAVGADEGRHVLDAGVSFIGPGEVTPIVATLLESDVRTADDDVEFTPVYVSDTELEELRRLASVGLAPSGGLVSLDLGSRLLGLIARVDGGWPLVPEPPAPPDALFAAVRASVPPHTLVNGGSGLGKTTLLEHLVRADAESGSAVVVVCPHGDLAERAAAHLSTSGRPVRMVDFGSSDAVTWNIVQPDSGVDPAEHASLLLEVLRQVWATNPDEFFGPVWTRVMRTVLEVLVRDPAGPWPLTRAVDVLTPDGGFRTRALLRIDDRSLTARVVGEIDPILQQRDPGNALAWLMGKLDPLVADPTFRAIIDHRVTSLPVSSILEGESLIVAIRDDRMTTEASRLLGGMLVGKVWHLVKRHRPSRPISLYLDEWQRIPVPAIGSLLAEGRKFGLTVRLANQNSAQIPRDLWETTVANVGSVVSFRTGPADALRNEMLFPSIAARTLTTLPNHWLAVASGGNDFVAPAPAPCEDDEGLALMEGHDRSATAARRSFLQAVAQLMQARVRAIGPQSLDGPSVSG